MTNDEIRKIAFANGFKAKWSRPGLGPDLHGYVFDFARAILAAAPVARPAKREGKMDEHRSGKLEIALRAVLECLDRDEPDQAKRCAEWALGMDDATPAVAQVARTACEHISYSHPSVDYVVWNDCGSVFPDLSWGMPANRWFDDLPKAQFYRAHGHLPDNV